MFQVFEIATNEPVGLKYRNRNGAEAYCDALSIYAPREYEVRKL